MNKKNDPLRIMLLILLFTLGFDQLSKEAAHLFGFTVHLNTGISFNLFSAAWPELLTIALLLLIVISWYKLQSFWTQNPVVAGLFFGGGLSNIFDRALYGGVRDWFPLFNTNITNNLADWALFGAITLLLWKNIFYKLSLQGKSK